MDDPIRKREQRLVLAHLILDLTRTLHDTHFSNTRFGDDADSLFVVLAVFIGQAEGRLMTAGKIAAYLDKPRTTVTRRLEHLAACGIVQEDHGTYCMVPARLSTPTTTADRMARIVIAAATKLSELLR